MSRNAHQQLLLTTTQTNARQRVREPNICMLTQRVGSVLSDVQTTIMLSTIQYWTESAIRHVLFPCMEITRQISAPYSALLEPTVSSTIREYGKRVSARRNVQMVSLLEMVTICVWMIVGPVCSAMHSSENA